MPLLYGEKDKAIIRLQEEIIRDTDDHSLFAWTDPTTAADDMHGMLAKSPASFAISREIVPHYDSAIAPYSITNRGLRIELPLISVPDGDMYLAALNCAVPPDYEDYFCILFERVKGDLVNSPG